MPDAAADLLQHPLADALTLNGNAHRHSGFIPYRLFSLAFLFIKEKQRKLACRLQLSVQHPERHFPNLAGFPQQRKNVRHAARQQEVFFYPQDIFFGNDQIQRLQVFFLYFNLLCAVQPHRHIQLLHPLRERICKSACTESFRELIMPTLKSSKIACACT